MKVIFLDFDGVLNSKAYEYEAQGNLGMAFSGHQLDTRPVSLLNHVVRLTDAKIVVSSAWRHVWSRKELTRILQNRGFEHVDSIIGITPSLPGPRAEEVSQWLSMEEERRKIDPDREPIESFVILDDVDEFSQHGLGENLVLTDASVGLTKQDALRAVQMLST